MQQLLKGHANTKRLLIDRDNATMLAMIGIAAFLVIFSLVASKALLSKSMYQRRVVGEKEATLKQLKENDKNVVSLVESYKSFAAEPENVLAGSPAGQGPRDGDNPKIVLDALPSKYDFPGLISSLEKVLKDNGVTIDTIGGSDDEIAQEKSSAESPGSEPIEMPFLVTIKTNYDGVQNVLTTFEKSIRPIYLNKLTVTAEQSGVLKTDFDLKSYYQPAKPLRITTKVVK